MNTLVILPLILCIVHAIATDKQDVKPKPTSSPVNTIQQNPKYEMIYQPVKLQQPAQQLHQHLQLQSLQQYQPLHQVPQYQPKTQYVPIQIIPKPYYVQQPQPQAMIIIAQPALVPQSLVYGSPTQQLLNYFHSNPQAKYQLLHGNYQQPQQTQQAQPTATYMHPVVAAPGGNYYLTTVPQVAPQTQLVSAPTVQYTTQQQQPQVQYTTQQQQPQVQYTTQQQQPQVQYTTQQQQPQLQYTTQQLQPQVQYTTQQQQPEVQYATQQAQPQVQHTQQQPVGSLAQLAQLAAQQYLATQMKTAPAIVTGFENFTPKQQAQIKAQLSTHLGTGFHAVTSGTPSQYSSKYAEQDSGSNFVPSPQIKTEVESSAGSQTGDILKTRYVKGKN